MGLLDDAIREHLELKRKAGIDPDEIDRLEQEALHGEDPEPLSEAVSPEQSAAYDEAIAAEEEMSENEIPLQEELVSEEPPAIKEPVEPTLSEPKTLEEESEIDEIDFTPPSQQTQEPPTDATEEEPQISVDVLEETPDFLENTPEHDRLWFEQKKPRDFDFDG